MVDKTIAYITCNCGEECQILNDDLLDWDEQATIAQYQSHTCRKPPSFIAQILTRFKDKD